MIGPDVENSVHRGDQWKRWGPRLLNRYICSILKLCQKSNSIPQNDQRCALFRLEHWKQTFVRCLLRTNRPDDSRVIIYETKPNNFTGRLNYAISVYMSCNSRGDLETTAPDSTVMNNDENIAQEYNWFNDDKKIGVIDTFFASVIPVRTMVSAFSNVFTGRILLHVAIRNASISGTFGIPYVAKKLIGKGAWTTALHLVPGVPYATFFFNEQGMIEHVRKVKTELGLPKVCSLKEVGGFGPFFEGADISKADSIEEYLVQRGCKKVGAELKKNWTAILYGYNNKEWQDFLRNTKHREVTDSFPVTSVVADPALKDCITADPGSRMKPELCNLLTTRALFTTDVMSHLVRCRFNYVLNAFRDLTPDIWPTGLKHFYTKVVYEKSCNFVLADHLQVETVRREDTLVQTEFDGYAFEIDPERRSLAGSSITGSTASRNSISQLGE